MRHPVHSRAGPSCSGPGARGGLTAAPSCASSGSMRAARVACIAGLAFALTGALEERDPAYWTHRLEQALLPLASMRATLVLETMEAGRPIVTLRGKLTRIQGDRLLSTLAIDGPGSERRILRIASSPGGGAQRALYVRSGKPVERRVEGHDRILRTAFTYADLGFVDLDHLATAEVEVEDVLGERQIILTAGPYGPYRSVKLRLDPESALPRRIELFDRRGRMARTVTYSDVRRDGSFRFPFRIEAVDLDSGRRSTVRVHHVELGAEVMEHEFSDSYLRDLADVPS